jgi:hypothetical protein
MEPLMNYLYVELHAVDNHVCQMPPTLVAYPEIGEPVELVGLKAEDFDGLDDSQVIAKLGEATTKPWEPTGRCCGSYKRDVWNRK